MNDTLRILTFQKFKVFFGIWAIFCGPSALIGMAQTTHGDAPSAALRAFDVAVIKVAPPIIVKPGVHIGPTHVGVRRPEFPHGRFICDYCSLEFLVAYAYNVGRDRVSARPPLAPDQLQVEATMPPETPEDEIRLMVQTLLAERFGLKLHRERKVLNMYALVMDSRVKMELVETETKRFISTPGEMDYSGVTMAEFAHQLSTRIGMPVADETGLKGFYRVKLTWSDPRADKGPDSQIFGAVKDQLGLALKQKKIDTEILVVDAVSKEPKSN